MDLWPWDQDGALEAEFWLPDDDHRFYGRLVHSRHDGPQLHFFGCRQTDPEGEECPIPAGATVFARTPGGGELTVLGFHDTGWTTYGGDSRDAVVDGFALEVLRGRHLSRIEALEAPIATASMRWLTESLTGGLIDRGLLNPRKQRGKSEYSQGEGLAVELDDGTSLLFHAGQRPFLSRQLEKREVHSQIQITGRPRPLRELEELYVLPVRDLVSFCTRRPSYVRALATHDEDPHATVEILRRPRPMPNPDFGPLYGVAFNLASLDDPSALIQRWLGLRQRVGAVWNLYFASFDREYGFLDNRFLNLLAFAEGYHRALRDQQPLSATEDRAARTAIKEALQGLPGRDLFLRAGAHANSQSQRERLLELTAGALAVIGPDWDLDPAATTRAMVDTRNWMIHWGLRTSNVGDNGHALARFCAQLELILYVAILRDLAVDEAIINDAISAGWGSQGLP